MHQGHTKDDTYIVSKLHIYSVLSDSDSVRAVRCVGEDVIAEREGAKGLQGRGLLDIHPGIELVTSAVCMDVL
jgi:hypothetical protein